MARRDQQSFVGFHFSEALFNKIFCMLDGWPNVDFAGLIAHDALIQEQWMGGSFAGAKLSRAKFYRTYVDPAIGPGVVAPDTDFSNADLSGADLRLSYISRCNFTNAMLEGTDFRGATIHGARFNQSAGTYKGGEAPYPSDWVIRSTRNQ